MKKLLTLSLVVLFVAVSSMSFAQDAAPAPVADDQPVQVMADDAGCCNGNGGMIVSGGSYGGGCAPCYAPSYGCAPSYCDPCNDPCGGFGNGCGYGYGYRTPVRNFLGRLFAPRAYYGCAPSYGCGPCAPYGGGYGYGGCAPSYGCGPCAPYGGGYGYGGCCY